MLIILIVGVDIRAKIISRVEVRSELYCSRGKVE